MPSRKPRLHVEIHQMPTSEVPANALKQEIHELLSHQLRSVKLYNNAPKIISMNTDNVHSVEVWPSVSGECPEIFWDHCEIFMHVGKLDDEGYHTDGIQMEGNEVEAARQLILPSTDLLGVWSSLSFEKDVKERLLRYINTAMVLADKGVDENVVDINRMILLHGPPGTGKTTLCRALSQKLAMRLSDRYKYGYLVEVNSHSLFSKWFSESGKLVQKMFDFVTELIEDPCAFVCVLIDEVESLAAARKASTNEPSDAIRVVNAVLTQLDAIKRNKNVIVMTTSNITNTVDLAFVDRADIVQYIGLPGSAARYEILKQSFIELNNKGLIIKEDIMDQKPEESDAIYEISELNKILSVTKGLSGRALRKLPFLALAESEVFPVNESDFMLSLLKVAEAHKESRSNMDMGKGDQNHENNE